MGTRSNVRFKEDGTVIGCLYRQYDGYPEGMGQDLLDILPGGDPSIVNGFGPRSEIPHSFNGIPCLAAYVTGQLKGSQIGNVYMYPSDHEPGSAGEEFCYDLSLGDDGLHLEIWSLGYSAFGIDLREVNDHVLIYEGPLRDFAPSKVQEIAWS